ncbi:DUF4935 domain-containing protein [Candidatus Pacearchaeota archaeon]|nr:DUF4935 domain-containing protein [Candidatus Pacearchaeota archaeon]
MKNKNILVIVDINRLGNYSNNEDGCKNYSFLGINKHLHKNIISNFSFSASKNTLIQIAIPKIVLEELKYQQKNSFENEKRCLSENFKKFSQLPNSEIKLPDLDYDSYLDEKTLAYMGVYKIKEIENPPNEILNKLIEKVLKKEKPFYKSGFKVDSGFKDSIIWESILMFVSKNRYDKYFFPSGDSDFEDEKLKKEFAQITGRELSIVKEVADLKGKLEEEINGTDKINNALESIQPDLLNILRSIISQKFLELISEGRRYDISNVNDYRILDINSLGKQYVLSLLVYFEHESTYAFYAKHGAFDKSYLNDKDISPAEIKLIFDEDYSLKEISSEEIVFNTRNKLEF